MDVGVNERSPAVARRLHDAHLLDRLDIEEPLVFFVEPAFEWIAPIAREAARRVPFTSLDDRDREARLHESACGHRAAETGAHYDCIVQSEPALPSAGSCRAYPADGTAQ